MTNDDRMYAVPSGAGKSEPITRLRAGPPDRVTLIETTAATPISNIGPRDAILHYKAKPTPTIWPSARCNRTATSCPAG